MSRAAWTRRARAEFEAAVDYLRERSPRAAAEAADDLDAAAGLLARFSEMGRPGAVDGTREFSTPRWHKVIVYRVMAGGIEVISLRDTRRLYRTKL